MRKKEIVKNTYEAPVIEVIEFDLSDSIATSGLDPLGKLENIWGEGN